jgi:cell shape-determining protein MreC
MKNFLQTTKTASPRSSKTRARIRVLIVLCAIAAFIYVGKGILHTVATVVTSPFYAVASYLEHSSAIVPALFRDRSALLDTQYELEARLAAGQGAQLELAHALEENDELRALLGTARETRIAAGVIGRPPYTPYDTLILDRGSDSGIQEYAPVFLGSGLAIGYVHSTTERSALVTLFSSSGVETSVYIFGPDIFARAHGIGGGAIRIDVPQGIALAKGDLVVLPSLDSGVLGTIDAVESTPTGPEQHAFVTLASPIVTMRLVSVGTQPVEPIDFDTASASVDEAAKTLFTFPTPEIIPTATGTSSTTDTTVQASSTAL